MHVAVPAPGSIVWIRQRRWRVERAQVDRSVVRLDVADRDQRITFLAPFDRPTAIDRPVRPGYVRPQQAVARLADLAAHACGVRTTMSAIGARIALLPHQLEPVLAVLGGARRVLVADDVGLGKTIQAGLVLAELLQRQPSLRALVIVPATLRAQWMDELSARFGVHALAADRHSLDSLGQAGRFGDSPWRRAGTWIASLDFLKQRHVSDAMPLLPWDLVILDEAHEACGDSERHDACADILRRARHVLLLTATPHSGDETRFSRLLHLGALPGSEDRLTVFRRTRSDVASPVRRRVRWTRVALAPPEVRVLDALIAFERKVLRHAGGTRRDVALLLLSVFRKRALSTMGALDRSLQRRLAWLEAVDMREPLPWMQPRLAFGEDADDLGDEDREGLVADIGLAPGQERAWLGRLRLLTRAAMPHESKIAHVGSLIARVNEPVVVFTEFRDSLELLRRRLAISHAVATLHGGQAPVERSRELDRFLCGPASVLLATDVAGQGLNLQGRSRWIVSLELPWNPARIQQRIGRVDRIGQPYPVHATLLVARHDAEDGLLARLARRTLAARRSFAADLLVDIAPPGQAAVAASLLAGSTDPLPHAGPQVALCRRWVRSGRSLARLLARKRRLARHWRGRSDAGHTPVWTTTRRLTGVRSISGSGALAIFSAPIVNGIGTLVERHVLAVQVTGSEAAFLASPAVLRAIHDLASAGFRARLARIRRLLAHAISTETSIEQAISAHLRSSARAADSQPGLFGQQGARAWRMSRRRSEEIAEDMDARLHHQAKLLDLSVARPTLEVLIRRPR